MTGVTRLTHLLGLSLFGLSSLSPSATASMQASPPPLSSCDVFVQALQLSHPFLCPPFLCLFILHCCCLFVCLFKLVHFLTFSLLACVLVFVCHAHHCLGRLPACLPLIRLSLPSSSISFSLSQLLLCHRETSLPRLFCIPHLHTTVVLFYFC